MQGLNTMIRLSKFQLDEKKRKLAELRDLLEQVQGSLTTLEQENQREQDTATTSGQLQFMRAYNDYRIAAEARKANLLQSITQIEAEIRSLTDDIAEAFQELKRYEMTQDERQSKSRKATRLREQASLDEFGMQAFRRKNGSGLTQLL
jgi:flagellar FliJ protein